MPIKSDPGIVTCKEYGVACCFNLRGDRIHWLLLNLHFQSGWGFVIP